MIWLEVVEMGKMRLWQAEVRAVGLRNRLVMKEVKEREVLRRAPVFLVEME